MQLRINRSDQVAVEIEFPEIGADEDASAALEQAIATIQGEWELLRQRPKSKPNTAEAEAATRWLKQSCYKLILHCENANLMPLIRQRIKFHKRSTNADNIFSIYLLGIFAEDAANFTERMRWRYSRELFYAHRHYVPWQFLNGFLNQVGSIDNKKDFLKLEDGFEDWIIERRVAQFSFGQPDGRGKYPAQIEGKVRRYQISLVKSIHKAGKEHAKSIIDHIFERDSLSEDENLELNRLVEEDEPILPRNYSEGV